MSATTLNTTTYMRVKDLFSGAYTRMANRVVAQTKRIQTAQRAARSVGTGMAVGVTAPAAFAARSVFNTALAFDTMRNSAQAAGRLTNDQIKPVEDLARHLGSSTQFTASQSMGAAKMLFKSGMDVERVLGTLKGTLDLAAAGELDLAEAADIATNVLSAMDLPMHDAITAGRSLTRVNDALAFAASNSNTDVRYLGESFKYSAPLASMVGMSVEDLSAAFMTMAKRAIKGSEAGVAMRSAIVRLLRPTKGMRAELANLGIDLRDFVIGAKEMTADGLLTQFKAEGYDLSAVRSEIDSLFADPQLQEDGEAFFVQLSQTIAKGLGDSSAVGMEKASSVLNRYMGSMAEGLRVPEFFKALRAAGASAGSIAKIFDAKQGARLATLVNTNEFSENLNKVKTEAKGAAAEMAKILMRGAPGEFKKMTSAYEGLLLAIAKSGVMSAAADAMGQMAAAFQHLSQTNPEMLKWGTFAILALAVVGPLALGISAVVSAFGALSGVASVGATGLRLFAGIGGIAVGGLGRRLKSLRKSTRLTVGLFRAIPGAAGKAEFAGFMAARAVGGLAGGIGGVAKAALALLGAINWPAVLGAAALTVVINKWDWLKGFFSELGGAIANTRLGKAFAQVVKWIEYPLKLIKQLAGLIGKVLGFGGGKYDAKAEEASGRSAARKVLDFVGLGPDEEQQETAPTRPVRQNRRGRHAPKPDMLEAAIAGHAAGQSQRKTDVRVEGAKITVNVTNASSDIDVKRAVAQAMEEHNERLRTSMNSSFSD